ncbi:MAG: NAD(P)-binding domain-containing protein, partial [Caulobacteraceae bacterium]
MSDVAFLGVGAMGLGMASNLAKAGRRVVAYDVSAEALARAKAAGCEGAGSAGEAVQGAGVVVTMLPAGRHVREVYAQCVVPLAQKGALVIDCSTIDVESARAVAGV